MRKTALITGGARRVGKQIALHLAQSGFDIALHYYKSENEATSLKKEIEALGVKCEIFYFDLTEQSNIKLLINHVGENFENIRLLVNSAANFKFAALRETSFSLYEDTFNLNFKAPLFLTKEFSLKFQKGLVINLLDTRIASNHSGYFIYTLAKKVLADFTKMAAVELAPDIRVNAIAPGFLLAKNNKEQELMDAKKDQLPLKRLCSFDDIFITIDNMLRVKSMTGQVVFLDGGEFL